MASGRIVLIVGATGSIGRAVCGSLAAANAVVVGAGRTMPTEEEGADLPGGFVHCDATDYASVEDMLAAVVRWHGAIDGVIDCTSVRKGKAAGLLESLDPGAFASAVSSAIVPLLNICHASLPHLRARRGFLITLASDVGKVAGPAQSIIAATQAARMMFVRSLASEIARDGVRINCVSTSFVADTEVYRETLAGPRGHRVEAAAKRAGLGLPNAGELAALMRTLASKDMARITGQIISINGGLST